MVDTQPMDERGSAPVTDLERKATVEQLKAERKKVYSGTIDEMKRQVGNYGQFFVENGSMSESQADLDFRALLLTESVPYPADPSKQLFVVITADGAKGIVPEGKKLELVKENIHARLYPASLSKQDQGNMVAYEHFQGYHSPESYPKNTHVFDSFGGGAYLLLPTLRNDVRFSAVKGELVSVDPQTIKDVILKSQAHARIPEEFDVNKATQKLNEAGTLLQEAKNLDQFIRHLPPKQ